MEWLRRTWIPLAVICVSLISPIVAQVDHPCACHPRGQGASGSHNDWEGYRHGGIEWHYSVEEALKIAQKQDKLVFWFHVAGDLDKEGC